MCDRLPVLSLLGLTSIAHTKQLHTSFLIHGDTNTGKSTLVHGIADRYNMQIVHIVICDLIQCGKEYADKKCVEVCNMVIALQSSCILVIDDIDCILMSDTTVPSSTDDPEIDWLILEVSIYYCCFIFYAFLLLCY